MRRISLTGGMVVMVIVVTLLLTFNVSATGWGNSFIVNNPAKNPDVAIDSNGELYFVWLNPTQGRIQYRHCADVNACDAVEELPVLAGDAFAPALALDSSNRPNVVWEQRRAGKSIIFYSRRNNGAWTKPDKISKSASNHLPDIAIGPDDVKHIVFERVKGNGRAIIHSTRGGSSNNLQLVEVESAEASDQVATGRNVRIVVTEAGRAHIVWSTNTNPARIKYSYQSAAGEFVPPILVADQGKPQAPDLAIDRTTNRVGILWETRQDDYASLALYKGGKQLFRRNNITGGNDSVRRPRISADCGGRFHLIFQSQEFLQADWNLHHRVFNPANEMFSSAETVTVADTDDTTPVIATTNFVAIGYIDDDHSTLQALRGELGAGCYGDPTPTPTTIPTVQAGEWEQIPNHDARILYTKEWQTFDAKKASGDSFARCQKGGSCKKNSSAELVFTGGTRVEWVTAYANNYGRADVYIDGQPFEIVDLCAPNRNSEKPKFGVRTYVLSGNENTPHSIKIVAVGRSGCSNTNKNFVAVDGFNIQR